MRLSTTIRGIGSLYLNALYYGQAANNTVHDITTQDISISAWVKVDVDAGTFNTIMNKNSAESNGTYLFYIVSNKAKLWVKDTDGDIYSITGTTALNDNKWHYVSAILDKSDATQSKVFLDGVDNTASRSGTLANIGSLTNSYTLSVGAEGGSFKLDGQIRDVKLYYAAGDHWTDAQVLYQAQHPFDYSANAGTMTDYWRLDEGSGTTLYGKVNNLTLSNQLAWSAEKYVMALDYFNLYNKAVLAGNGRGLIRGMQRMTTPMIVPKTPIPVIQQYRLNQGG